jgi:peptidoglycan hydrolase-like protein with peptidoglycan-binding domain
MAMRLIMVFVLLVVLTGCLKKVANENLSEEPTVTEEAATGAAADVAQEPQAIEARSVSVEPAVTQLATFEKPSIQDIQQALKNANLYEGKIDGILGPNTRKAIEVFQSQNSLKADGKVGPKTWEKLQLYLNKN